MKKRFVFWSLLVVSGLSFFMGSCKKHPTAPPPEAPAVSPAPQTGTEEPKHILVQHILIGYKGSLPGKQVDRSLEDAAKLAEQIFAKARATGADFDVLVKQYTDDQAPGIYGMSNNGIPPEGSEYPRGQMVPAFGNIGFKLGIGEVGIAPYSKTESPFGFHIIKRLK